MNRTEGGEMEKTVEKVCFMPEEPEAEEIQMLP